MIIPYSAKNSNANPADEYSTLKPDTSSDSPSEKSKGVRLVSATHETNQIIIRGKKLKKSLNITFIKEIKWKSKVLKETAKLNIIKAKLIS